MSRQSLPLIAPIIPPQGRLTLATATPVMTSDQSAKTTIFYTPAGGNQIPIYDGANFRMYTFTELSNITSNSATGSAGPAVVANTSNYDLFVWNNAGTLTLTRGPLWTSDTARGAGAGTTQLSLQNGINVNTVAITNGPGATLGTYVGSVRSNGTATIDWLMGAAGTGTAQEARLCVWNAYNRRTARARVTDTTASWSYTSATVRASNNSNGNRISFINGLSEDSVSAQFQQLMSSAILGGNTAIGIGLDSTTTISADSTRGNVTYFVNENLAASAPYAGYPGLGFHFLQAQENSDGANANTFFGAASNYAFMAELVL